MFLGTVLLIALVTYGDAVPLMEILEVPEGQTVQIPCESKDKNHTFAFWELATKGIVLGPGNEYNENKYDYNILNGTLYVREVSPDDEGVYICFSRDLMKLKTLHQKSIKMVILRDWSRPNNSDNTISAMGVILLIGCILILLGAGYLFYRKWSRAHRLQSLLLEEEDDEEDSGEDIFTAPGTSKSSGQIILDRPHSIDESLSTDFGSILSSANK